MNLTPTQQLEIAATVSPYWASFPQHSINQLDFMRQHSGHMTPHGTPLSLLTVSIREAIHRG